MRRCVTLVTLVNLFQRQRPRIGDCCPDGGASAFDTEGAFRFADRDAAERGFRLYGCRLPQAHPRASFYAQDYPASPAGGARNLLVAVVLSRVMHHSAILVALCIEEVGTRINTRQV